MGAARQGYSVALSADGNTLITGARADNAGAGALWGWVAAALDAPSVGDGAMRDRVMLAQAHPNPTRGASRIRFAMAHGGHASLRVFDVSGREVRRLVDGVLDAGSHEAAFDSRGLAGGLYFYRLEAGGVVRTRRLVVER